jgi:hypothetical protein
MISRLSQTCRHDAHGRRSAPLRACWGALSWPWPLNYGRWAGGAVLFSEAVLRHHLVHGRSMLGKTR